MSDPTAAPSSGPWPVLDREERRVLGVLIEKQKTTPDAYPMSLNAVTTGCNQKSNRDPILDLPDVDVEDALEACMAKGLATKIVGGRVDRWRHLIYDAWKVEKKEIAVLAELLLRGPQTEGELRGRASRMEPFDDLDALRAVLKVLVERKLVVYLTEQDRRGAVLTHGFHDPAELEVLRRTAGEAPPSPSLSPAPASERRPAAAPSSVEKEVADLRDRVTALEAEVRRLKQNLGVSEDRPAG